MKKQTKTVFPLMLVFTMVITLSMSQAFAETISVSVPAGTSVPGCETTNECYIPEEVTINVGDTVIWSNDDSAAHTVTGGSAADGPSGIFDSSLFWQEQHIHSNLKKKEIILTFAWYTHGCKELFM
jgi:plastocyanin